MKLACAYSSTGVNSRVKKRPVGSRGLQEIAHDRSINDLEKLLDREPCGFPYDIAEANFEPDLTSFLTDSPISTDFGFDVQSPSVNTERVSEPELSTNVFSWPNSAASLENAEHPLDHKIGLGDDLLQDSVWPEALYKDFSTFSPLRSMGRAIGGMPANTQDKELRRRIWHKVQSSSRMNGYYSRYGTHNVLPSYALPEAMEFIDSFFLEHYSYPNFVSKEVVLESFTAAMRSPSCMDQSAFVLLNSVLAIGCQYALCKHPRNIYGRHGATNYRPLQYFQVALDAHHVIADGNPSILKLQALVSMVVFVQRHDAALTRALLSQAIAMVSDLSQSSSLTGSTSKSLYADQLEHIFWLLYSIEKPHALRFGNHSIVDDDLLIYHAPSRKRTDSSSKRIVEYSGWEIVNYRYARLCSVIVKTLYSHASLRMTGPEASAAIDRLSGMLDAWRLSIPVAYRPHRELDSLACHEHGEDARIRSEISLRYAEASFAIHRWVIATKDRGMNMPSVYASSTAQCIVDAKQVLSAAHSCSTDSGTDWPVVMLPALAAIILYMLMRKGVAGNDCLPYLGIAAGFFGKLSVKAEFGPDLFMEMSELLLKASDNSIQDTIQTPPLSNIRSVEEETISMQIDGDLDRFDFPHDVSSSIFNISSLEDMVV